MSQQITEAEFNKHILEAAYSRGSEDKVLACVCTTCNHFFTVKGLGRGQVEVLKDCACGRQDTPLSEFRDFRNPWPV